MRLKLHGPVRTFALSATAAVAVILLCGTRVSLASPVSPLLAKELAVLTNQGISPARAMQAIEVQGKVAQTNLVSNLEASMASGFAGVWFEPATARLHVGVTSPGSRGTANAVIAQAGLPPNVTVAPVRSTLAQLLVGQKQWNHKLANLFARAQVQTALQPQYNAVRVTLSSSVSASERAALAREAATASVNVLLTVVPAHNLAVTPEACTTWQKDVANCDPSIPAGVKIESQPPNMEAAKEEGESHNNTTLDGFAEPTVTKVDLNILVEGNGIPPGTRVTAKPTKKSFTISNAATKAEKTTFTFKEGETCTAGPIVYPVAKPKERYVLTAGHCVTKSGGAAGQKWVALKRNVEEGVIGPIVEFENNAAADYATIQIEQPGFWSLGGVVPVFALTTEWGKAGAAGEQTYRVKGERLPIVGNTNCHMGQTTGESCGKIRALNVTSPEKPTEGLVEDETAISAGGDSGGPWLFIGTNNEVLMEGTHVGKGQGVLCVKVGKVETGVNFFSTAKECYESLKPGKGEWERKTGAVEGPLYEPLKQPPALVAQGVPSGSLEKAKLELLTTANEPRPCGKNVLCDAKEEGLRDDLATPPTNGQFGTNLLAQNTKGGFALTTGSPTQVTVNKSPQNYDFVGLQLHSNPLVSPTVCNSAGGYVQFADFQNSTLGTTTTNSPVYVNTLLFPFRVLINSVSAPCTAVGTGGEKEKGLVTIRDTEFYIPVAGVEAHGALTGKYVQPGATCSAGGVELALAQPGLVPAGSGFDNGTSGEAAFLCFVSANNYVYPTVGKEIGPLTGAITDN